MMTATKSAIVHFHFKGLQLPIYNIMVATQFRMRSIVAIVVGTFYWSCLFVCGKKPPAMILFDIQHKTGFDFANADMKKQAQTKSTNDLISCAALCGKVR